MELMAKDTTHVSVYGPFSCKNRISNRLSTFKFGKTIQYLTPQEPET